MASRTQRPKVTVGPTIKKVTGCGNLYVTINSNGNEGTPVEILARLGKSGECAYCQNEALTRSISLGLKYGVPINEYVRQLIGIQCSSPHPFPMEERALSCADAIAHAMKEYLENCKVSGS